MLAFGEVLWDVVGEREYIGGAPFNFAAHAVRCGLAADLWSRIGTDARGQRAQAEIRRMGVGEEFLQIDPERPTGWVDVQLRDGQPTYTITEGVAWDAIAAPGSAEEASLRARPPAALVCGTLAQRSPESRRALGEVRMALPEVPVFYDVNLRPPHTPLELVEQTLPGVTWLKLNADEAVELSRQLYGGPLEAERLFGRLRRDFGLVALILTRGAEGASLLTLDGALHAPAARIQLVSAVGAGDAFAAAFLAGWLTELPHERNLQRATRVAGWVASRAEAIPDYPAGLLD